MFLCCKLGKTAPPNMTHLAHCCLEEVVLLSGWGFMDTLRSRLGTPYPWLGVGLRRRKREPGEREAVHGIKIESRGEMRGR